MDVLARMSGGGGSLVAWLRLNRLIHTPKIYHFVRARSFGSSISPLLADLQTLYMVSAGLIHLLACVWFESK